MLCIFRFAQGLQFRRIDMMINGIAKDDRKVEDRWREGIFKKGLRLGGVGEFVVIDENHFRHKRKLSAIFPCEYPPPPQWCSAPFYWSDSRHLYGWYLRKSGQITLFFFLMYCLFYYYFWWRVHSMRSRGNLNDGLDRLLWQYYHPLAAVSLSFITVWLTGN